jgi:hypothetical protein
MTSVPASGDTADSPVSGPAQELTRNLILLLANVGALTALLVYFGWRRSEAHAARLGIDESLLGMSTQDYVLRSIGSLLGLLLVIGGGGLCSLWIHHKMTRLWDLYRCGAMPRAVVVGVSWAAAVLGVATPVVVYALRGLWTESMYVGYPLSLGAGLLLILSGAWLRSRLTSNQLAGSNLVRLFLSLVLGVLVFWAASNRAEVLGNQLADEFAAGVRLQVRVTVFSEQRLHLDAAGVTEDVLQGDNGAFRYRYRGLRLLEHTGEKYFLVPDTWNQLDGTVIVLIDHDNRLRFEFGRGIAP